MMAFHPNGWKPVEDSFVLCRTQNVMGRQIRGLRRVKPVRPSPQFPGGDGRGWGFGRTDLDQMRRHSA